ncbi:CLUMA_CG008529, isoform A [Clunio marinus]|uniref:CLUMA_CG008529, isoform A n=1 Tax=Clunio marinus TaxID=568069 RepID=A0A1J1I7W5_9DIPT|nr:CLUMA_CG008529, isoform A [Clunio marinus]
MVALAFISGAQSSTNQQQSQSSFRGKLLSNRDESAKYETSPAAFTSLLSKVNPWLSACDLAHPSTAPDLQGLKREIIKREQRYKDLFVELCENSFSSYVINQ